MAGLDQVPHGICSFKELSWTVCASKMTEGLTRVENFVKSEIRFFFKIEVYTWVSWTTDSVIK